MRIYGMREMCESILKKKGISKRELGKRIGASDQLLHRYLWCEDNKISTVRKLCDGMGVELCVIDGWRKYRLNEMVGNVDIDTMLESMRGITGSEQSEDRYLEQREKIEERKERARERSREYARSIEGRERIKAKNERKRHEELEKKGDVCLHCARCDARLERGFRHWCNGSRRYEAKVRCTYFIQKDM